MQTAGVRGPQQLTAQLCALLCAGDSVLYALHPTPYTLLDVDAREVSEQSLFGGHAVQDVAVLIIRALHEDCRYGVSHLAEAI